MSRPYIISMVRNIFLSLRNLFCIYLGESPLTVMFKKQISHLTVNITDDTEAISLYDLTENVYGHIFTLFTNLTHLEFGKYNSSQHLPLTVLNLPSYVCLSSTIVHLCVKVLSFDDCLCLLDGRLCQMNTLTVIVDYFYSFSLMTIDNTVKKIISNISYSFFFRDV
jgi:hypothetical protein